MIKRGKRDYENQEYKIFHHLSTGPAGRMERSYKTTTHVRFGIETS
jgi:hypothetical protein